jgi:superfamily I DNA/RNA helicase
MQERVNKLIPAVSNKHKSLIATFHSFCAKFLSTNLIPAVMKPFGIANKSKETEIIKQCISQLNIDTEFHKPSKIMNNISLAKGLNY